MKSYQFYLLILLLAIWLIWRWINYCEPVSVSLGGKDWNFPSTVGEATGKHHLDFHPPGYYFKTDSASFQYTISYHERFGDFDDERQVKEALYSRDVQTYTFHFKRSENTYDSLKSYFETRYRKKFILTKGFRTPPLLSDEKVPFKHYLLKANDCLTIGIKNSKSSDLGDIVTVRMLFDMAPGDVGIEMDNW